VLLCSEASNQSAAGVAASPADDERMATLSRRRIHERHIRAVAAVATLRCKKARGPGGRFAAAANTKA
jgi:hypothetical protein